MLPLIAAWLTCLCGRVCASAPLSSGDTIPLQAQQTATRVVELTWTPSGTATLYRRYPDESDPVTIGTTSSGIWIDHHARGVCGDTVYYSLSQGVEEGYAAVFVSDLDPTSPAQWGVVTVDSESQRITLSWAPSVDTDIMGYLVCEGTPSIAIDTVFGRANTTYTYTLDSSDVVHLFRICAFDSCRKASALTSVCNNMVAILSAQPCSREVTASWNQYHNMPGEVGGYNLYVAEDDAPFANAGSVAPDISDFVFQVSESCSTVRFYVEAFSTDASLVAASNIVTYTFGTFERPQYLYLRKVTVSDDGKAVVVVGQTDPDYPTADYRVYRSVSGGAWSVVGHTTPDINGALRWTDATAHAADTRYTYCFGVTDACGRNEMRSQSGSTILPLLTESGGNVTIEWNPFEAWSGTTTYLLLTRDAGSDVWQPLSSSASTTYTDQEGNGQRYYKVQAFEGFNSQYDNGDSLQSATVYRRTLLSVWVPSAFTPSESTNNTFRPIFSDPLVEGYSLFVYNRQGLLLFSSVDPTESWDGTFRGRQMPNGAYTYMIKYLQTDGTVQTQVGTVTIIQ